MRRAELITLMLVIAMTNDSHSYDDELDEREPMKIGEWMNWARAHI